MEQVLLLFLLKSVETIAPLPPSPSAPVEEGCLVKEIFMLHYV